MCMRSLTQNYKYNVINLIGGSYSRLKRFLVTKIIVINTFIQSSYLKLYKNNYIFC